MIFRLSIALSAILCAGTAVGQPQPTPKDPPREKRRPSRPREAPPPPQAENPGTKAGHVWVGGHWEWKDEKYAWTPGHWEADRPGQKFRPGKWEKKGDQYVWIGGVWSPDGAAANGPPREAPPPPKAEGRRERKGFTWVPGRWDWRDGKWQWQRGRFEAERPGKKWREGHWDKKGDVFVFTDGDWIDDASPQPQPGYAGPREAPPAPRAESYGDKPGHVWIAGRWDWKNGKWEWLAGRWEAERKGKKWRAGRWDKKGDVFVFTDGDWENDATPVAAGPREAPPPPRAETPGAGKPGLVWVGGRYDWKAGKWEWIPGHWERERAGKKWRPGRWDKKGDVFVFTDGDWEDDATPVAGPPRDAPPPPRAEAGGTRRGQVFIRGRWDWRGGKWEWIAGRWENERPGKRFREGRWDKKGDVYVFTDGDWIDDDSMYPSEAPPPPRVEAAPAAKPGTVWVAGRWEWKNKWEWIPGHWERERAGKRWRDGRWERNNDRWVFVDGDWIDDVGVKVRPRGAPPPPRAENPGERAGHVWIAGRWDWRDNNWAWTDGHWERERANQRWRPARWEQRAGEWVLVEGEWGLATDDRGDERRRRFRLERPVVGSFFPTTGAPGTRVVIRGRNFRPGMEVIWNGEVLRSKGDSEQVEFEIPKAAPVGKTQTISLRSPRGLDLPVGLFEVAAGVDALAEQRKLDLERKRAAEAAAAARAKKLSADRAAREAEIKKRIEEREASRDARRAARLAALRARWDREFLGDAQTQDELTLHSQRLADLVRMQEVADLANNQRLTVRVELALSREQARHERRMTALKAAFKGGKP